MTPDDFHRLHGPTLERDEPRHNLLLGLLQRERRQASEGLYLGSLERPGACALRQPGYGLVLGALDRDEAARLAEETLGQELPSVVGPDDTAPDFVARSAALGRPYAAATAMQVLLLAGAPNPQPAPGVLHRPRDEAEAALMADWVEAFRQEAVPNDPAPPREKLLAQVRSGSHFFWSRGGEPVALGAITRELSGTVALGPIYTPPAFRGRGYAGALTAALSGRILAGGRRTVCLFQELANEAAARCYARVGFRRHCLAWHILRGEAAPQP